MQGAKYLKRMTAAVIRAAETAPPQTVPLIEELSELLIDLTPFVDTGKWNPEEDKPIGDAINLGENSPHSRFYKAQDTYSSRAKYPKGLVNSMNTIFSLTKSSIRETNAEGDQILLAIANKCVEVMESAAGV